MIQKAIENKMQVGMDFGWLLDRSLVDFEAKLGFKLAPKSEEMGYQDDVENHQKTRDASSRGGDAVVRGPGP